jgi:hypothetical protein
MCVSRERKRTSESEREKKKERERERANKNADVHSYIEDESTNMAHVELDLLSVEKLLID